MIIDKGMLAKFLVTVIVIGSIGYYAMYTFWPSSPIATIEPLDSVPTTANPEVTPEPPPFQEDLGRDYFVDHRMERERERSERIALLREVVNNPNSTDETRAKAQMEMIDVAAQKEIELHIERLIVGKGFADAVVFFSPTGAEVIVKAEAMSEAEALQVADVISTVAGVRLQNIRVRFRK